jgi:hypothetical protein
MALDITIRIPESERRGFLSSLLRMFPSMRVIEERTSTEEKVLTDKVDPNMLFGKWADFDKDGRSHRRESWRREEF